MVVLAEVVGMDVDEAAVVVSVHQTDAVAYWPVAAVAEGRRAALMLFDSLLLAAYTPAASAPGLEAAARDTEEDRSPDVLAVAVAAFVVEPAGCRKVD